MSVKIIQDIKVETGTVRPPAIANKAFPYADLPDHRRFEELLYTLYRQEISNNCYHGVFDEINLMQGVRERGMDCVLLLKKKHIGLIQCKHSIAATSRISAPECAKEIIKFVLHYLVDNRLISDVYNFTYFFAVSYDFSEKAVDLLDHFEKCFRKLNFQKIAERLIKDNAGLRGIKYDEIEARLIEVLSVIKIKKIRPQDIDILLLKPENRFLIGGFFEVKTVTDNSVFEAWMEAIMQAINAPKPYVESTEIPATILIKQMKQASFNLEQSESEFAGIEGTHIDRSETKALIDWIQTPLNNDEAPLALVVGNAGIGKTVVLKDLLAETKALAMPVIGIKADRYYVSSIAELEQKLNLEVSLERICKSLQKTNDRIVVLIDQIDALSLSLSSRRDYLDTFRLLIEKLCGIDNVRVIVSVRAFDLAFDSDLKAYNRAKKFLVKVLESPQIKKVIEQLGLNLSDLSPSLTELLTIPHHLNVFCKIYNAKISHKSINNLHDLYGQLWEQKIIDLPVKSAPQSDKCKRLVYAIAEKMNAEQHINISVGELPLPGSWRRLNIEIGRMLFFPHSKRC